MSITRFIIRSILHFRRQHLAVFAGTLVATAVLTGALIVGDSVRFSLARLVDLRLGKTQYAILSGARFLRAQLAAGIEKSLDAPTASLILLKGIAIQPETGIRIPSAQVIGIDSGFIACSPAPFLLPAPGEALVSQNTARRLGLKQGDSFLLRVEKAGLIPVNAPFSPENGSSIALRLTVKGIAGDDALGRFSLRNNQQAPFNVFVNREYLAEQLQLDGLANLVLLSGTQHGQLTADKVQAALRENWKLQDAALRIDILGSSESYDLTSSRVFIDDTVASLVSGLSLPHAGILTYLANDFSCRGRQAPYSFVTAATAPIIPGGVHDNEIIINRWLADDIGAHPGDTLKLDYFVIGPLRKLDNQSGRFVIRNIIPTDGSIAAKALMPSFPGLSDAGSCRDWNTGIPIDLKKIRDKDEKYWNEFRGSPKAYITLKAGQRLWKNRFGNCTAIRFSSHDLPPDSLKSRLLKMLVPHALGIEVIPVRAGGKYAAANSVDFGSLFLYLSFFVIAGSLLLLVLIHMLNTETRSRESAVLAGLGFIRRKIILLRLLESAPVVLIGGVAGAFAGIAYNNLLVSGLNSLWQDALHTDMLVVRVVPATLITGALSGSMLAFLAIWWVSSRRLKNPVAGLLRTSAEQVGTQGKSGRYRAIPVGIACMGIALAMVGYSLLTGAIQNAGLFLTAGALFLAGSISLAVALSSIRPVHMMMSLAFLSLKNAGRSKGRSLSVVLLLALGVFTIVLTGSYRRTFFGDEYKASSGTGGYLIWAETALPVPFSLDSKAGRDKLILSNSSDLDSVHFLQLHSLEGDDASCLNLNQVQKPRLLGVPLAAFNSRNAFTFVKLAKGIDGRHPWLTLEKAYGHHVYPAYADQTVIQYGLKKSIGDTLQYLNEQGETVYLILEGGLDNSIFQGSLLVDDHMLLSEFPSSGGSRVMLAMAPLSKEPLVAGILNKSLQDYGIEVTPSSSRLAAFNTVENTYLAVFMMLGGLGMLIGTFGLGLVLLRNLLERKHELALLFALGFPRKMLMRLVMQEYLSLLVAGLLIGIISAFIAIMPSLLSPVFNLQAGFLAGLLAILFLSGLLWIFIPVRIFLRNNLSGALRND